MQRCIAVSARYVNSSVMLHQHLQSAAIYEEYKGSVSNLCDLIAVEDRSFMQRRIAVGTRDVNSRVVFY